MGSMSDLKLLNRVNPLTEYDTEEVETEYSRDIWQIVESPEDGMVYLKNPPQYDAFEQDFAWEKTFANERKRRRKEEPIRSAISDFLKRMRAKYRKRETIEVEAERLLIKLRGESERPKVIDVGCGIGVKLQRITRYMEHEYGMSIEPIGIEISLKQACQANTHLQSVGGHCIQNNAIDGLASVADDSVDLIILCSFLEHEINPMELLRQCQKKLASHGRLLIKVPNYDCKNRKYRKEKWCGFRYPDHVNYFVPKTLQAMLERANLNCRNLRAQPFNDNMWAIAGK